jgi:hypothetical protein
MGRVWLWLAGLLLAAGVAIWAGPGEMALVDQSGKVVPTITVPRWMWVPGAVCATETTAGSVWDVESAFPAVPACVDLTNTLKGVLDFSGTATSSAQFHYRLPTTWTGNIPLTLFWYTTAATAGNVAWRFQVACTADGELDDPTFGTVLNVVDANKTTAGQLNTASETLLAATHLSACAGGELLHVVLFRDPAFASDTLDGVTARLIGVEFTVFGQLTTP